MEIARPRHRRAAALSLALTVLLTACGAHDGGSPEAVDYPHPDFEMTDAELQTLLADAPAETRQAVGERPQYFLELAGRLLELPGEQLRLVDKDNALPAEWVPGDLVPLDRYGDVLTLNRSGLSLRAVIMPDLLAMVEAARQEGILLPISSTYRSYEYQAGLFERHVENLGEEEASRVSARPGTSQHQLGTTLDFGSITLAFADTEAGRWLAEHAGEFGFSMSYPDGYEELTGYSFEPWHFRWLGRVATEMEAAFFGGLQQHMLEFWHEHARDLRAARRTR
jgi:D-alanyl-D-alanine carboxypeptidase